MIYYIFVQIFIENLDPKLVLERMTNSAALFFTTDAGSEILLSPNDSKSWKGVSHESIRDQLEFLVANGSPHVMQWITCVFYGGTEEDKP